MNGSHERKVVHEKHAKIKTFKIYFQYFKIN